MMSQASSSSNEFFPQLHNNYIDTSLIHHQQPFIPQYPHGMMCAMEVQQQQNICNQQHYMQPIMPPPPDDRRFRPSLPHSTSLSHPSLPTTAMDSCQQISHVLQCYQQGGEDSEFVRRAIESLVKKLKDKREELDALITAVTSSGKQSTACVTIQRSLDGRLQVAGRKGVPHVVYARIWRWPNVSKNELVKLSSCGIPIDHQDFICINPYHYERVVSNGIPPLDMRSLRVERPTKNEFSATTEYTEMMPPQQNIEGNPGYTEWMGTSASTEIYAGAIEYPSSSTIPQPVVDPLTFRNYDLNQVQVPIIGSIPEYWSSIIYYELDTPIGEAFKARSDLPEVVVDGGMDPQGDKNGRFCLGALSNVHRDESSEKTRIHISSGIFLQSASNGNVIMTCRSRKPVFVRSGFLDYCSGVPYGSKVHKFSDQSGAIVVFDLRWAYMEMLSRTRSASQAVRAQAAAVAGFPQADHMSNLAEVMAETSVDGMRTSFCSISISFVKGWGVGYPRQDIKDTPCWIEIQLHRPLQLLNHLLKTTAL